VHISDASLRLALNSFVSPFMIPVEEINSRYLLLKREICIVIGNGMC